MSQAAQMLVLNQKYVLAGGFEIRGQDSREYQLVESAIPAFFFLNTIDEPSGVHPPRARPASDVNC